MRAVAFFWAINYSSAVPVVRNFSGPVVEPGNGFPEREEDRPDRVPEYDEGPRWDELEREIENWQNQQAEQQIEAWGAQRDIDQWSGHMY